MTASTNQFLISDRNEFGQSIASLGFPGPQTNLRHEWQEKEYQNVVTITAVQPPDISAAREFCERVSKLPGTIVAVMVEELDGREQHVTTFLSERSRETESEIYRIEAEIIDKYRDVVLDFHTRAVRKDETGKADLPDGSYYLLTWQAS